MDSNHDYSFVNLSSYNQFRRKTSVKRRTRIKAHVSNTMPIVQSSSSSDSSSVSPPPTQKSKKKKKPIKLAWFQIFSSSKPSSLQSIASLSSTLIFYSFNEISTAIEFTESKLSPSSWHATLRNQQVMIFRRNFLNTTLSEANLTVIFQSHHRSLVKLLGASLSHEHIYIVYDHSCLGSSLKDYLKKSNFAPPIFSKWMSRMQIALDVANGLDYIHHHCRLIHHEINSSNVIITTGTGSSCNAKICLFGAAYVSATDSRRTFSKKSDVFYFGIMIFELISGKMMKKENIVIELVKEMINKGEVRRIVDRMLWDSFPEEVAETLIRVALKCIEPEQDRLPEMVQVAAEISKLHVDSKNWEAGLQTNVDIFDLIRDHIIVKTQSDESVSDSDALEIGR